MRKTSSSELTIRPALLDDLQSVRDCALQAYSPYIPRIGIPPAPMVADFALYIANGTVYVGCLAERIIGYVVFFKQKNHLQLENIAVLPEYTGQGLGKQLILFVERTARAQGINRVELYTNVAMSENLAMYSALGYTEVKRECQDGFHRAFFYKSV